ncbi:hypothetical protein CL176_02945 [Suicoccus acidiformans]|uniref:Metal homeostasis protein n=1 Tax=Suicoccus acidiformans TaxID=2036206 RepID=A0A347WJ11_9LACT|nr:putative metal homeostasis protein [Suicoccus acidiformans]AXY25068.1 hypothetical protein CL176_02945 [Suicoccus acidiformans]
MQKMSLAAAYRYLNSPNIKTRKRARKVIRESKRGK